MCKALGYKQRDIIVLFGVPELANFVNHRRNQDENDSERQIGSQNDVKPLLADIEAKASFLVANEYGHLVNAEAWL